MAPRLFVIINGASDTLFYASTSYVEAKKMYKQIPEIFADSFVFMRYDPCELWKDNTELHHNKNKNRRY